MLYIQILKLYNFQEDSNEKIKQEIYFQKTRNHFWKNVGAI